MRYLLCGFAMLAMLLPGAVGAQHNAVDPMAIPAVKAFLAGGFGERHDKTPEEVAQFGRLVGLWRVRFYQGADFGTFTASLQEGEIVMKSPPGGFGLQRVVFYEIGDDAFRWRSDYSPDKGESWKTVMRMHARRHAR